MKSSKRDDTPSGETATLPVLNIMFLLIPTLLLAMEVASMAAMQVSPPLICGGCRAEDANDEPDNRPRTLKVMILADGFRVEAAGAGQGSQTQGDQRQSTLPLARPHAPANDYERWDYLALAELTTELRPTLAEGATLEISAEGHIPMQVLVSTIDAAQDLERPLPLTISSSP